MNDKSYHIRVPKRWVRLALIVGVTAMVVAPLTAVATHTFTDVPNDHTFHGDITWLADADVTRGCNPPTNSRYCPNDLVTRGQMAAFIKRLAENRVVDAASLEGMSLDDVLASGSRTIINGDSCSFTSCPNHSGGDVRVLASTTINAPTAGVIALSGSANAAGGGGLIQSWIAINQTANNGCGAWAFIPTEAVSGSYAQTQVGAGELWNLSHSTAVSVPAGQHTAVLCTYANSGTSSAESGLQAIWSADGSGVSLTAQAFDDAALDAIRAALESDQE